MMSTAQKGGRASKGRNTGSTKLSNTRLVLLGDILIEAVDDHHGEQDAGAVAEGPGKVGDRRQDADADSPQYGERLDITFQQPLQDALILPEARNLQP